MGSILSPQGDAPRISTWTSGAKRLIQTEQNQRWTGGQNSKFLPEGCVTAHGWPLKCDPDSEVKKERTPSDGVVSFNPLAVYADNYCPSGDYPSMTDFNERTQRALANNWPLVLSEELMDGVWTELAGTATNPDGTFISNPRKGATIRSAATAISPGAHTLKGAISALLRTWRMDYRLGTTPVLHIPDWALSDLPSDSTEVRGREIWTNYGTILVAPGPGYSGNGPHDPGASPAVEPMAPGAFWIYLTGMIHFDLSVIPDPIYLDGMDGFEVRTSTETNIKETNALAVFDPCAVLGALVQVSVSDSAARTIAPVETAVTANVVTTTP